MRTAGFVLLALPLLAAASASDPPAEASRESPATRPRPPASPPRDAEWSFSLLPKSLQSNPVLDMTVYTEMSAAGRSRPPPDPGHPAYYAEYSSGQRHFGEGPGQTRPPTSEELERALRKSLAAAGYLPCEWPLHPPSLFIFLHWGSHTAIDTAGEVTGQARVLRNLRERAALIGGDRFADRLMQAYRESQDLEVVRAMLPEGSWEFLDPVARFRELNATNRHLVTQAGEDIYFAVASAYDYAGLMAGKRVLLWRTKMTANTQGVSMQQTLAPLLATASPYFGRETAEAVPISRRGLGEGIVEAGEPTVVEFLDEPPERAARARGANAPSRPRLQGESRP